MDRLGGSLLDRLCCCIGGKWFGIPFQYPTKYLCYRADIFTEGPPPISWPEFQSVLRDLTSTPRNGISAAIGLQGKAGHPALYYEWLAFALALGGGDVLWSHAPVGGRVILDSKETVEATERFRRLFDGSYSHEKSLRTDWLDIVDLMVAGEIAMCLPFSDTLPELNSLAKPDHQIRYVPFCFQEGMSLPPFRRHYAYSAAPVHVFSSHVMVAVNHHVEMRSRISRFFDWFLELGTQRSFLREASQSPLIDTLVEPDPNDKTESVDYEGRNQDVAGAVAQRYASLPVHSRFVDDEQALLPTHQQVVLDAISGLLHGPGDVKTVLSGTAKELRGIFSREILESGR